MGRYPQGTAGIRADPHVAVAIFRHRGDRVVDQAVGRADTGDLCAIDVTQSRDRRDRSGHHSDADVSVRSGREGANPLVDQPVTWIHGARVVGSRRKVQSAMT